MKKSKADEYVKILGFVTDEELDSLYKNSIALVYPSLSEGFGLQGIEAMASGTIVLMSGINVFKEIYRDSVIYFDPKSVLDIKEKMKQAVNLDGTKRESMIENGRKYIKEFSWSKMAEETMKEYGNIIKGSE